MWTLNEKKKLRPKAGLERRPNADLKLRPKAGLERSPNADLQLRPKAGLARRPNADLWERNFVGYAYSSFECRSAFDAETKALAAATHMLKTVVAHWTC